MKNILLGATPEKNEIDFPLVMGNRHGFVTGATGTGKTVTLQVLAESFSRAGVPVFAADIKGDLTGLCEPARPHKKIEDRVNHIGISDYAPESSFVTLWDIYAETGLPVKATVADMGPQLLAHLLDLNETQEGVLFVAFSAARDEGLELLDIKDLRAILNWMETHRRDVSGRYGNVSTSSIGAIQRRLLVLEESGGDTFFGEPMLDIQDLLRVDSNGRGQISLLDGRKLMLSPQVYTTFLFWLLTELFEKLPEIGNPDKPVLVFFFDEAHLLFENANDSLLDRIEQVVRLIRSKGVGVYFVTQNPLDIPEDISGQLGNKLQHALRAFTGKEQKAVKAIAQGFRENPAIDTEELITSLGVGEALVSFLDDQGVPRQVEHCILAPPRSQIGPASASQVSEYLTTSALYGKYGKTIDRESAHEQLAARTATAKAEQKARERSEEVKKDTRASANGRSTKSRATSGKRRRQGFFETFFKSILRTFGTQLGRQLIRTISKILTGGKR